MPRQARKDIKTPFLHVIVQGVNKEYIFYKKEYIEKYLEIIANKKKDYKFEIIAYCMMNNHAHFLVYTENVKEFGKFMQRVNLIYAQIYNKEEKRCGVLFRNRYQTEPIYDMKYLINCINYIHNNPVKAKIVKKCEEYKYSSYNDYLNNVGVSQNIIMKKIFGKNYDYCRIFNDIYEKRFIDIDDENCKTVDEYIANGISEFKCEKRVDLVTILSDRKILKELIKYLKEYCNIKYVEIRNFLRIPRGTMDILKNED